MNFDELLQFVQRDMRMSHVYQPIMLRELLSRRGRPLSRTSLVRSSMRTAVKLSTIPRLQRTWSGGCLPTGTS